MSCVWMLQRGHSGDTDRCDLTSTLCKYDLRKGDLFVKDSVVQPYWSFEVCCMFV